MSSLWWSGDEAISQPMRLYVFASACLSVSRIAQKLSMNFVCEIFWGLDEWLAIYFNWRSKLTRIRTAVSVECPSRQANWRTEKFCDPWRWRSTILKTVERLETGRTLDRIAVSRPDFLRGDSIPGPFWTLMETTLADGQVSHGRGLVQRHLCRLAKKWRW